jgi:DNA-binding SARP family transcriptional activator
MDVKVLGPVSVSVRQRSILPTAGKPRQVLTLLVLHADRLVTVPTLMEEVWGEAAPRSAATTLQTYILQLRRLIARALDQDPLRQAKDVLVTQPGGYLLEVAPGEVDATQFGRLAAAGRRAYAEGDAHAASDLLGKALELWRGPALADVSVGRVLELEVLGLEEARMAVLERRIDADLRLGRHAELIGELRVLAAKHPMNENLYMQLMLALYRSGNVWRALEAFHTLRRTLNVELGLEPSVQVRKLQQAMLSGDPALDVVPVGDRLSA